jgi:hypothetical protein
MKFHRLLGEPNRIELNMSLWNRTFSIFWCFLEFDQTELITFE